VKDREYKVLRLRSEMSRPFVVACIPAYNEERSIAGVLVQTLPYVDRIIVCDDGSSDLTAKIAEGLGAMVVRHEENLGKGAALKSAFNLIFELNPDVVVMLDADGQHDPSFIPRIVEPIVEGMADIVIGSRFIKGSNTRIPVVRRFGLKIFNALISRKIGGKVVDTQSGFRAFSYNAFLDMSKCGVDGFGVETEQLFRAYSEDYRILEVPVCIKYDDLEKTSSKNVANHGTEVVLSIIKLIVAERPLSTLGIPGSVTLLFGISSGAYFLWYFNSTRYFSIPMALLSLGGILLGMMLIITSLILYSMTKIKSS